MFSSSAAVVSAVREGFHSRTFKTKGVMTFQLITFGTAGGQTIYDKYALRCPCSPSLNCLYGLAVFGVPALVLFLVGVIINHRTRDILSECNLREWQKVSRTVVFSLLVSIMGWAAVAPITWVVLSLLRGKIYVCAFSEFVDPASVKDFPRNYSDVQGIMAAFPCKQVPEELLKFWTVIERRLMYESEVVLQLKSSGASYYTIEFYYQCYRM